MSNTVNRLAGQAQDGIERTAKAARDGAGNAAHTLYKQGGRAVDEGRGVVRDHPVVALAAGGVLGFILGVLLCRR